MSNSNRQCKNCLSSYDVLELRKSVGGCPKWIGSFCSITCKDTYSFYKKAKKEKVEVKKDNVYGYSKVKAKSKNKLGKRVKQVNGKTGKIRFFKSVYNTASHVRIPRKTLSRAIGTKKEMNGFYYEYA